MMGDCDAVSCLVNNAAFINAKVPSGLTTPPQVHPITRGWTALHFAVQLAHARIARQLLDRGAHPEGRSRHLENETLTVTPLQLACAAGEAISQASAVFC